MKPTRTAPESGQSRSQAMAQLRAAARAARGVGPGERLRPPTRKRVESELDSRQFSVKEGDAVVHIRCRHLGVGLVVDLASPRRVGQAQVIWPDGSSWKARISSLRRVTDDSAGSEE